MEWPNILLDAALAYAKKGWSVFPCRENKSPMITGGKGFKEATTDEEQIRQWWKEYPQALIGIATGAVSGIVVLDVDNHSKENNGIESMRDILAKHKDFKFTIKASTPSGGYHFYFKHQFDIRAQIGYAPGVDIKSDGGYVIAPPSRVSDTKRYTWCENKGPENELIDAPGWMAEVTQKPVFTSGPVITEGKRDVTMTSFAGAMRARGASPEAIYAALGVENKKCSPSLPDSQLRKIANSVGRYETKGRLIVPDTDEKFWDTDGMVDESGEDTDRTTEEIMVKYHIPYLSDYLLGIMPSELVIVGADTGTGKTQFANDMAFYNVGLKKHVYLFSLEGDRYDVIKREWYRRAIAEVRKDELEKGEPKDFDLSYDSFITNIHPEWIPYRAAVKQQLKDDIREHLHIFKRKSVVSVDDICEALETVDEKIDLVVVDHLHYFELMTSNEYTEITEILKKIRELVARLRVPVILVSHLRQKHRDRIVPGNEDFHGTSNIPKQADTCIILSKYLESQESASECLRNETYPTLIHVTKSRRGKSNIIAGIVDFNGITKVYSDRYQITGVSAHGVFPINCLPKWAAKNGYIVKKETNEHQRSKGREMPDVRADRAYKD